jgi:hypothetical protein
MRRDAFQPELTAVRNLGWAFVRSGSISTHYPRRNSNARFASNLDAAARDVSTLSSRNVLSISPRPGSQGARIFPTIPARDGLAAVSSRRDLV